MVRLRRLREAEAARSFNFRRTSTASTIPRFGAKDAHFFRHDLPKLISDSAGIFLSARLQIPGEAFPGDLGFRLGRFYPNLGKIFENALSGEFPHGDELQNRIGSQAVESVKACRRTFPHGKKTGHRPAGGILHLPAVVGRDSTHVVMVAGSHRTELGLRIQIYIFFEKARDFRNFLLMHPRRQMPQIDPDMLDSMVWIHDAAAFPDFRLNRPGDEVPGSQFLHFGSIALHKGLQVFVS